METLDGVAWHWSVKFSKIHGLFVKILEIPTMGELRDTDW